MVVRTVRLGRRSKTDIAYVYIKGITNPLLIEELEERLNRIDIDQVIDSGHLEQLIQDNSMTTLPQIQSTERPDKAVANLMEGRVVILVDNSPFALMIPTTFSQLFKVRKTTVKDGLYRQVFGHCVGYHPSWLYSRLLSILL